MSRKNERRIYVGNLPPAIREKDLDDLFSKFGKITFINLKNQKGSPFAFIQFEDPRNAEDAIRERHRHEYDGYTLRVELPRGSEAPRGRGGGESRGRDDWRSRGRDGREVRGRNDWQSNAPAFHDRDGEKFRENGGEFRDRNENFRNKDWKNRGEVHNKDNVNKLSHEERGRGPMQKKAFRVKVTGLPPSGSWQDLKDHMRDAGEVCYSHVFKDGTGVCAFVSYNDMKYAVRKLDNSRFKSHGGEISQIRVHEDDQARGNGHKRSRSRSRSYSPPGGRRRRSRSSSR